MEALSHAQRCYEPGQLRKSLGNDLQERAHNCLKVNRLKEIHSLGIMAVYLSGREEQGFTMAGLLDQRGRK